MVRFSPHDFYRKKSTALKEKLRLRKRGLYARVQHLKATRKHPSVWQVYVGVNSRGAFAKRRR